MKIIIPILTLLVGLISGSVVTRRVTISQYDNAYPPQLMKVLSSNAELTKPMSKKEFEDFQQDIKKDLATISNEWDVRTLAEGMLAGQFCQTLDKSGSDEARRLAISRVRNFRERYEAGMNLSDSWRQLAKVMYEKSSYAKSEEDAPAPPPPAPPQK